MGSVITIPALNDNFSYLFRYDENKAIAVDPADASLVLNAIKRHNLELTAVLTTHHHWDHTAGIKELKHKTNCTVFSGNQKLVKRQSLDFGNYRIKIIATPTIMFLGSLSPKNPPSNLEGMLERLATIQTSAAVALVRPTPSSR